MAGTRRFVKVFLASPGDLAEERKVAKVIVDDFNSQLADALGYQVELVGWEDTLPVLAGRKRSSIATLTDAISSLACFGSVGARRPGLSPTRPASRKNSRGR